MKYHAMGKSKGNMITIKKSKKVDGPIIKKTKAVVKKGGDSKTELENIDAKLHTMKNSRHMAIKDLKGEISGIFNDIVTYITSTYETPSSYADIYKKVETIFEDVKSETIVPGTCSALCAGSMPSMEDVENPICEYTIYIATYNNDKFTFTMMNNAENRQDVIIYVTYDGITKFPGLTESEKRALEARGVEMINLISFNPSKTEYNELTSGFLPLSEIKLRMNDDIKEPTTNVGLYVGIGVLILFGIILIGLFIYFLPKIGIKKSDLEWS